VRYGCEVPKAPMQHEIAELCNAGIADAEVIFGEIEYSACSAIAALNPPRRSRLARPSQRSSRRRDTDLVGALERLYE
jgi:hypothetical protein